ncbi:hypothetical protein A7981_08460 [Methylovorus sp. MM2]|uniref:hypothetical protein n=1 Tax=Methylovorus sp. MM2 TaxID=1848038 RepID=UPI0007E011E9|nr:hypothetical protein [Methylovorus sp. MM2]OAM51513.1 hypothetical protein A7981_08460 [Methylovorus sp. MM2]
MTSISIKLSAIEKSLNLFLREASGVLSMLRETKPGDGISLRLRKLLIHYKTSGWAKHYLVPDDSFKAKLLTYMQPDEINALGKAFESMSSVEHQEWVDQHISEIVEEADSDTDPLTEEEIAALSEDEKADLYKRAQFAIHFSLVTLFNHFSYVAYKKPIYQLVNEAIKGNDESFLQAIQIDKTVLEFIPYFNERNLRAATELDFNFQRRINTYRNKPILQSRIKHHQLWLVFAYLDEMNVLDQFENYKEELLGICQRLGIYGPPPDKDFADIDNFNKLLSEFKKNQSGIMPKYGNYVLVNDVT